ncbi:MAG: hypothetical protein M1834_005778 [Cirrosporium novae-zelandiae]|nr:MAG: hypothetical protein M1834_005778 [Cirrosporium novae-zelandiae]
MADDDAGPTSGPPKLPDGWLAQWDGRSRRYYYVQRSTGHSTWDVPTEAVRSPSGATPIATPQPDFRSTPKSPLSVESWIENTLRAQNDRDDEGTSTRLNTNLQHTSSSSGSIPGLSHHYDWNQLSGYKGNQLPIPLNQQTDYGNSHMDTSPIYVSHGLKHRKDDGDSAVSLSPHAGFSDLNPPFQSYTQPPQQTYPTYPAPGQYGSGQYQGITMSGIDQSMYGQPALGLPTAVAGGHDYGGPSLPGPFQTQNQTQVRQTLFHGHPVNQPSRPDGYSAGRSQDRGFDHEPEPNLQMSQVIRNNHEDTSMYWQLGTPQRGHHDTPIPQMSGMDPSIRPRGELNNIPAARLDQQGYVRQITPNRSFQASADLPPNQEHHGQHGHHRHHGHEAPSAQHLPQSGALQDYLQCMHHRRERSREDVSSLPDSQLPQTPTSLASQQMYSQPNNSSWRLSLLQPDDATVKWDNSEYPVQDPLFMSGLEDCSNTAPSMRPRASGALDYQNSMRRNTNWY